MKKLPPPLVSLIGAGPGDPDLLTRKAYQQLLEADAVVYDRLVSPEILELIPAGVMRLFAGKSCAQKWMTQEEINETLVTLAKKGHRVVRLKGGDPFLFGRGSEEAMHLAEHHIPYEVIPGITSASGCAAYAGIPLTHRGLATRVQYFTGHLRSEQETEAIDWKGLADPDSTLVIYMGLGNSQMISDQLIQQGLAAETPAAIIENGTTPRQRTYVTTLKKLPADIESQQFKPPALIIVGKVVGCASALAPHAPAAQPESPPVQIKTRR